jgi:hypothetical protein
MQFSSLIIRGKQSFAATQPMAVRRQIEKSATISSIWAGTQSAALRRD